MTSPRSLLAALIATGLTLAGCSQPNDMTLPGQVAVGDDGFAVTVTFEQVENLVPNSQVLHEDVEIGTVTSIDVDDDWQAVVELRLLEDVDLPANVSFAIGQKTLLGAQYVEVIAPDEPQGLLRAGARLPVARTGVYPSTEQVLGAASLLLNNGGLSQISTITEQLTTALDGRVPQTRDLLKNLNTLLTTLDANKGQIIGTLESLERFTRRLDDNREVVAGAVDRITPALRTLDWQRKRLVAAVEAAGRASRSTTELIALAEAPLVRILASLRPTLARLSTVSGQLPEALNYLVSLPFPVTTTDEAIRGDYANLFATIDLSASALADAFGVVPDDASRLASEPGAVTDGRAPLEGLPVLPELTASPPNAERAEPGPEESASPDPSESSDKGAPQCSVITVLLGVC